MRWHVLGRNNTFPINNKQEIASKEWGSSPANRNIGTCLSENRVLPKIPWQNSFPIISNGQFASPQKKNIKKRCPWCPLQCPDVSSNFSPHLKFWKISSKIRSESFSPTPVSWDVVGRLPKGRGSPKLGWLTKRHWDLIIGWSRNKDRTIKKYGFHQEPSRNMDLIWKNKAIW